MAALFDDDWVQYLQRCQADWGLTYSVHLPMFGLDPANPVPEIAQASIQETIRAITCTRELDVTAYVLHVGTTVASLHALLSTMSPAVLSDLWAKSLTSAQETLGALTANVDSRRILIENLPSAPLEALLPLIEAYDFGICLDVGHADLYGSDPAQLFQQYEDRIGEIHFHDVQDPTSPGGRAVDHRALGTGRIGYQRLLDTFAQRGFGGNLVIELVNPEDEHLSVQLVRAHLDRLPA
jgi:sugar phosphate isomerase/epimerase